MPGTPTSPDNLPIIEDTDAPDVPYDMNNLATKVQQALHGRASIYATEAELIAAMDAAGGAREGMTAFVLEHHLHYRFNGANWVAAGSSGRHSGMAFTTSPGTIPVGVVTKMGGWAAQGQPLLPAGWTVMPVTPAGLTIPYHGVYSVHCAVALDMAGAADWKLIVEPTVGPDRPPYVMGSHEWGLGGGFGAEASGHWTIHAVAGDVIAANVWVSHAVSTFLSGKIQIVGPI